MTDTTRNTIVALLWTVTVFTFLAAIWLVSWQWAATGGLLALVAATFTGLAMQDDGKQYRRGGLPPQTATITTEHEPKRDRGDER